MPLFIYSVTEETIYTVAVEAADRASADEQVYEKCDDGEYYGVGNYIETQSEYTGMKLIETLSAGEGK